MSLKETFKNAVDLECGKRGFFHVIVGDEGSIPPTDKVTMTIYKTTADPDSLTGELDFHGQFPFEATHREINHDLQRYDQHKVFDNVSDAFDWLIETDAEARKLAKS